MLGSVVHATEPGFYVRVGEPKTGPTVAEQVVIKTKHKLLVAWILLPQLPLKRRKH